MDVINATLWWPLQIYTSCQYLHKLYQKLEINKKGYVLLLSSVLTPIDHNQLAR